MSRNYFNIRSERTKHGSTHAQLRNDVRRLVCSDFALLQRFLLSAKKPRNNEVRVWASNPGTTKRVTNPLDLST